MSKQADAVEQGFSCPDCDQTFTRQQGLTRHMRQTHGTAGKSDTNSSSEPTDPRAGIAREVEALLAPIVKRREIIDAKIAKLNEQIRELRKDRAYIEGVLRKVSPHEPKPKREGSSMSGVRAAAEAGDARKLELVRTFVTEHAGELTEGFTREQLLKQMREYDLHPMPSSAKLVPIFDKLRDEGVLRADQVTRGGGLSFVLVSQNGDHA